MNRRIYATLAAAVGLATFSIACVAAPQTLYLYGSRSVFFVDWSWITTQMAEVGGFAGVVASFAAQFLHIDYLGAAVVACLAMLCVVLVGCVERLINGWQEGKQKVGYPALAILPAAYLVSGMSTPSFALDGFVALIVALSFTAIALRVRSVVVATLLAPVVYMLAGEMAILYPIALLLSRDIRLRYIPAVVFATLPLIAAAIWLRYYPSFYAELLAADVWCYVAATLAAVVANRLLGEKGFAVRLTIALVALVGAVGAATYRFTTLDSPGERIRMSMERAMVEADYEELLRLAQSYPHDEIIKCYATNLALVSMNRFAEDVLKYRQYGIEGLNFGQYRGMFKNNYTPYIYATMSLHNIAYRYTFETLMGYGLNRINLNRMVDYSLATGREQTAKRYKQYLDRTLFSSHFHTPLPPTSPLDESIDNLVCTPQNMGVDMINLANTNTLTKPQADYLLVGLLLANRVMDFAQHCHYIKRYYKMANRPAIYDEALVLLKMLMSADEFAQLNIEPSYKSLQRHQAYEAQFDRSNGNIRSLQEFRESYFYYIDFVTPYRPKIITEVSNF